MIYIAIGSLGFLVIHLFDIFCLKRIPVAKPATWLVGGGLLIYSLIMISLAPNKLPLPAWSTGIGWGLLLIATSLLAYSLFINLPFRKTYVATGVGDKLVVTGLYSLVRHPGVHWFIITMLALVLVTRSQLMLIAAPVFILLDIILVVIQDKFFFRRIFRDYDRYRRETPMLLPNRKSIDTFKKGLRPARTK
jgi:protein-S-isoprenylcysteine O-methyltransferase Ste14